MQRSSLYQLLRASDNKEEKRRLAERRPIKKSNGFDARLALLKTRRHPFIFPPTDFVTVEQEETPGAVLALMQSQKNWAQVWLSDTLGEIKDPRDPFKSSSIASACTDKSSHWCASYRWKMFTNRLPHLNSVLGLRSFYRKPWRIKPLSAKR